MYLLSVSRIISSFLKCLFDHERGYLIKTWARPMLSDQNKELQMHF